MICLLIVAYLMTKQLSPTSQLGKIINIEGVDLSKIPTSADDLKKLKADMDKLVEDRTKRLNSINGNDQ